MSRKDAEAKRTRDERKKEKQARYAMRLHALRTLVRQNPTSAEHATALAQALWGAGGSVAFRKDRPDNEKFVIGKKASARTEQQAEVDVAFAVIACGSSFDDAFNAAVERVKAARRGRS